MERSTWPTRAYLKYCGGRYLYPKGVLLIATIKANRPEQARLRIEKMNHALGLFMAH
ncbi:MAG: hypothetical protein OHK0032_16370 [Thermodesulfovibrionales bacterium]